MRSISFKITEKLSAGIEIEAGFFSLDNWTIEAFGVLVRLHFPIEPGSHSQRS